MTQWSTGRPRRLDDAFLSAGSSSFSEFVSAYRPELLPFGSTPALRGEHRGAARHDHRLAALRRGRRHGRRPSRHDGQRHRQPGHGEGLRRRRLQRRRDRRHGRDRDRARPALPGRARALREDRGRHHVARGQGQPPRLDDPGQPLPRHAGPHRRPDVCRLRPRVGHRTDLLLRRHGWLLHRGWPPLDRVGLRLRPRRPQEAVAAGSRGAAGRVGRHRGALRRRRRRLRHRRPRPRPPDLADRRRRRPLRRPVRRRPTSSRGTCSVSWHPVATTREVPDEHAVLRPARAGHEGPGRLRAQGDRAWTFGHRRRLRPRHRLRRREPVAGPAQGVRDLRPHRLRRGRSLQRVREPAGRRHPVCRPARLLLRPHRRHGAGPRQHVRPDARRGVHPGVQAVRDRDRRGRGRGRQRRRPDLPAHLRRVGRRRAGLRGHGWCQRRRRGASRHRVAAGHDPRRGPATGRRRARRRRERRAPRARRGPARGGRARPRPSPPLVPAHRRSVADAAAGGDARTRRCTCRARVRRRPLQATAVRRAQASSVDGPGSPTPPG